MYRFNLFCFFSIVFLMVGSASRAVEDICSIPDLHFASCDKKYQNFKSVVLAVHGWGGSCKATFGSGKQSLFRLLDENSFFDVDCFPYEKNKKFIKKAPVLLLEKIKQLHDMGYQEVLFVTHSLGGVVTLKMLMNKALRPDRQGFHPQTKNGYLFSKNKLKLKSLHLWAIPLNGVRTGWTIRVPYLSSNALFLKSLREDLKIFYELRKNTPPEEAWVFDFPLIIYQGGTTDWVVKDVQETDAWVPTAPKSLGINIFATGVNHSENVGNPGVSGKPTFPTKIMEDQALLSFSLLPRWQTVFSIRTDKAHFERQLKIIDGIRHYAELKFTNAYEAVSSLMLHILNNRFARSSEIDERIINDFYKTMIKQSNDISPDSLVIFFKNYLQEVLVKLNLIDERSIEVFGSGSSKPILAILKVINYITDKVNRLVKNDARLLSHLRDVGGIDGFNSKMVSLQARFLSNSHDVVKRKAAQYFAEKISTLSNEVIQQANLVDTLNQLRSTRFESIRKNKNEFGKIFVELATRPQFEKDPIYNALFQPVTKENSKSPLLWQKILSEDQVRTIVKSIDPLQSISSVEFEFTRDVVARVGASGNSPLTAILAGKKGVDIINATQSPSTKLFRRDQLIKAAKTAGWTNIRTNLKAELQSIQMLP